MNLEPALTPRRSVTVKKELNLLCFMSLSLCRVEIIRVSEASHFEHEDLEAIKVVTRI